MIPIDELPTTRIGLLKPLRRCEENKHGQKVWLCQCDCGGEVKRLEYDLRRRRPYSCGCVKRPRNGIPKGASVTREYYSYRAMMKRCYSEDDKDYCYYGERGITVCDRWIASFPAFLADMGPRPDGKTLDRIDVNGNYEPGNCRWATPQQQSENRRNALRRRAELQAAIGELAA